MPIVPRAVQTARGDLEDDQPIDSQVFLHPPTFSLTYHQLMSYHCELNKLNIMAVSQHDAEVDIQDENLVSEAIRNGGPRFVTAFVPTVTAISTPALWTDEEARRVMADAIEGLKYVSPLPDELTDDTPPNRALMKKYGDKLPLKLDFPLRGINQEWETWVDVIGKLNHPEY